MKFRSLFSGIDGGLERMTEQECERATLGKIHPLGRFVALKGIQSNTESLTERTKK